MCCAAPLPAHAFGVRHHRVGRRLFVAQSAHSYMTWKTQRDAWKVAEVGNFIEEQWHLLCLDQEKDSHELFQKDKKAGKWRGPLNSYWTTHEKKYFTKPHRGYWGTCCHSGWAMVHHRHLTISNGVHPTHTRARSEMSLIESGSLGRV